MGSTTRVACALLLALAFAQGAYAAADVTISEPAAGPSSLSSTAGLTGIFSLQFADGTADALGATVDAITFNVTVSGGNDATDFNWELFDGAGTFSPTTVTATTVVFSTGGPFLTLATNTTGTLTLRASVIAPSATIDNATIDVVVDDTDVTTGGAGSSMIAVSPVNNATNTAVTAVATEVRVVTGPAASQTVGTSFSVSVEYTDANGNRDGDVSDAISVTRGDAGAVTSGGTVSATNGLATFPALILGMPGNITGTLVLTFTDQAAGINLSGSPVNSATFLLVAPDDQNSTLTEGAAGPATLSSVAGLTGVFNLLVSDIGTSDAKATIVNGVTFNVTVSGSGDNAMAFTWQLFNGAGTFSPSSVTATTVVFASTPLISVANGGSGTLTLRAQVTSTSDTLDNKTLAISVAAADVTTDAAGTSLLTSTSASNSVSTAVAVVATALGMVLQPGAGQSVGSSFNCSVEYCDASGRRDRDVTDTLSVARSDAGTVTLPSPAQAAVTLGLGSFAMTLGMPGNLTGTLHLVFADLAGGVSIAGSLNSSNFTLSANDDANSTLAEGTAGPATLSSVAGLTGVFNLLVIDAGTSDAKATIINGITFNVTVSGSGDSATAFTWQLFNGSGTFAPMSVTATTVVFSASPLISVANGGNGTLTLRAQVTAASDTLDNKTLAIAVAAADVTTNATGTSLLTSTSASNSVSTAVGVVATALGMVLQPGASQSVGASFNCSVEYADAGGRRDIDVTDTLSVARNDAGTVTLPSPGQAAVTAGLGSFAVTLGMPGNLTGTLRLVFADLAGGVSIAGSLNSSTFTLSAADDANSTITEGAAGAATLASSAGLTGIFNLTVADLGTSDAKATIITDITYNITISGGVDDALDFNWQLFNGSTTFSPSATTATTVSFSSATLISVANGGSGTLTLRAQVSAASATIDNKTISVNVTSAGITTSASGTSIAGAQSVTKAVNTTVTVTATQIQVVQNPSASESVGVSFQVTVQYADAQGNRDLNAGDLISVTRNDGGAITLPSPAQVAAVQGLSTFNMTLGLPGNLSSALQLTYTDLATGGFNFSGSPKNTSAFLLTAGNDANSTITENPVGPGTLSSIAALSPVFNVRITDLGTSDGLATTVNGVTFTVTVSGGSDSTAQFTWELFNGSTTFAPSGTTATTVSFASTPLITVANSSNGTLTLRAQVTGSSATIDNKTIDIQVTTASFTIAGGTTSLAASQTVNNATNTVVTVAATELQLVGVPPTGSTVNTTIPVSVEYTDVNGNRDLNVNGGESVTATWSGAGAVTNPTMTPSNGLCNFGTNNLRLQTPGVLAGTITFTDNVGGSLNVGNVQLTPFDLTDLNDANSLVQQGPTAPGSELATITSITGAFTNVFDFRLRDQGTSDGLPTIVTQIVIAVSGTGNAGDHTWRLNGPAVSNVIGVVAPGTITFSGFSISVANNTSQDFTLSLQLASAPALTTDNNTFLLSLANTGVTTSGASTTMGASSTNNGAGLTYTVAATKLTVITQPGASQTESVGFDVRVAYTDVNGNIDINVTDTITGMTRSDAGSIQAPTFPRAAVNGVVVMTGANQVRLGLPAAASITLTFTDNAGGTLTSANIVTNAFTLLDVTLPTVTATQLQLGPDPRGRTVRVTFSEPLKASTVTVLTNYTLSFAGLHPTSITQPTSSQADLVFADYAVASLDTLAVSNVQDVASNIMAPVTAQPITSTDVAAPTLVSISFNDSDGSGTPTTGDQYLFLFNEAINDRIFSGGTSANTALSPAGLSYGTPNSVSFGDDQGLATDSRLVLVTLVAGLTVTGSETITLAGITDLSGNTAAATALTLTVVDNISPRLLLTRLDDRDNNGNASIGDVLHVYFSEAINVATMPLINTTLQMDIALGVSGGGSFGTDATASFVPANKELLITLGTGSPSLVGKTLNPPVAVTDPAGNPDATSPAVAVATGTSDIFAPSFTLGYSAANPNAVPVGPLTITATFTDTQPTTPTIAINQPGLNDLAATNMTSVGGSTRIWSFNWSVNFADGTINVDGINVVTIVGRPTDLRGNALVPASNNTFKTDTTNPVFASAVVTDPDNFYRSGDTISILATLNETGLSVTANLSVVDSALGTQVPFIDNGNGTYSLTSPALSAATLIEGSNIAITVRARDVAQNTSTVPVLVNIDDTAPTAALLYDKPSTAVSAGNLTITLSLSDPSPTVPTIAISGLSGTPAVAATPMTGSAGQSSYTFVLNVINPTTGTASVIIANVSDLAGNPPATVSNASFTVDTSGTVLVANAGPDRIVDLPQQVQLDASGSLGPNRTYVWTQDSGTAVTLSGATTANPTFFVRSAGAYVFRVTVTSGSNSADDTVTVTLQNTLPYVDAGQTITLDRNDVIAGDAAIGLLGSAFDVNGDSLFITWSLLSSPASGNIVPATPANLATALNVLGGAPIVTGVYRFQLSVYDPLGVATPSTDSVDVIVLGPGVLPPYADAGPDLTATVGQSVALPSTGSGDADGSIVAFQWRPISRPVGSVALPTGAATATAHFTPDKAGVYEFGLRVIDNANLVSAEDSVIVVVHDLRSATFNRVPRASALMSFADTDSNTHINAGEVVTLAAQAFDADSEATTLTFRQISGPEALDIQDPHAALVSFAPGIPGNYVVRVEASDASGASGVWAELSFVVAPAAAIAPVALAAIIAGDDADLDGHVLFIPGTGVDNQGTNPTLDLDGTGSTGTSLTFAWRQVSGPTLPLAGVTLSGISVVPVAGTYVFELTVTDANGLTSAKRVRFAVDTFDATANPTGKAVARANAGADIASAGGVVILDGTATDADTLAASLKFQWVQVGGPPIVLDTTLAAQPRFTPPVAGVYVFELYVSDGDAYSLADSVTVTDTSKGKSGGNDGGSSCATQEGISLLWLTIAFGSVLIAARRKWRRA